MALPAADFEAVLGAFLSVDNTMRNQAAAYLNSLTATPDVITMSLLQALRTCSNTQLRSLAAVLIRKVFQEKEGLWAGMTEGAQSLLKTELLHAIREETEDSIRRQVCDTIGELGAPLLEGDAWPELLPFIFACITSNETPLRISALQLVEYLGVYLARHMQAHFGTFRDIFIGCLRDPASPLKVKQASLRALASLLICSEDDDSIAVFEPLVPLWLDVVHTHVTANDVQGANVCVSVIIDVLDMHSKFFNRHASQLLMSLLSIVEARTLPDHLRQICVEAVTTLAEKVRVQVRKMADNGFLANTLPALFGLMLEVTHDAKWETTIETTRALTNPNVGEEALERIAPIMGYKRFVSSMKPFITSFLSNSDWKYKRTGLLALAYMSTELPGTPSLLDGVIKDALPFLADAHPQVQYAALDVIGALIQHHSPTVQLNCHETIMPAILGSLQSPSMRVRAHAGDTLVRFLYNCIEEVVEPYMNELLHRLYELLRAGPRMVQEQAMTALASLADVACASIGQHYNTLMPVLKDVIRSCVSKDDRQLRGRTMECIASLGGSIEPERFRPDAEQIMQTMLAEASVIDNDDPQRGYFWHTWTLIAKAMGEEFKPYLSVVMPSLLEGAKADHLVTDGTAAPDDDDDDDDDDDEDDDDDDDDGEGEGKDQGFRVRTEALEERASAVRMLCNLAYDLKSAFGPYVPETVDICLPLVLLEGEVYEDLRAAALSAMPPCIEAANLSLRSSGGDLEYVRTLLNRVLGAVLEVLPKETDLELIMTDVQVIKGAIEAASLSPPSAEDVKAAAAAGVSAAAVTTYLPILSAEQLHSVTQAVMITLQGSLNRRAVRRASATVAPEDYDEEEMSLDDAKDTQESELMYHAVECLGGLCKTHHEQFLPVFQELTLQKMLDISHPVCIEDDRKHALFLIDDVIEHCAPGAARYFEQFVPVLIAGAKDESLAIRQAAFYGLGLAAGLYEDTFAPYVAQVLPPLVAICNVQTFENPEQGKVHDNAVTALGKVLIAQGAHLDQAQLVPFWLSTLPLTHDMEESRVAIRQVCTRITELHCPYTVQASEDRNCLGKVLHVFAWFLSERGYCTEAMADRVKATLAHLRSTQSPEALGQAWTALSEEARTVLLEVYRSGASA